MGKQRRDRRDHGKDGVSRRFLAALALEAAVALGIAVAFVVASPVAAVNSARAPAHAVRLRQHHGLGAGKAQWTGGQDHGTAGNDQGAAGQAQGTAGQDQGTAGQDQGSPPSGDHPGSGSSPPPETSAPARSGPPANTSPPAAKDHGDDRQHQGVGHEPEPGEHPGEVDADDAPAESTSLGAGLTPPESPPETPPKLPVPVTLPASQTPSAAVAASSAPAPAAPPAATVQRVTTTQTPVTPIAAAPAGAPPSPAAPPADLFPAPGPPRRGVAGALQTARSYSLLLALAGVVVAFLALQGRLDRRDPRIVRAPAGDRLEFRDFE